MVETRGYRVLVLRRLGALSSLDDFPVGENERATAKENSSAISVGMIQVHSYSKKRSSHSYQTPSRQPIEMTHDSSWMEK